MVQLYMGNGKGKTSAAAGAAVRAAGSGIPVIFGQFLKDSGSGEIQVLRRLPGLTLLHTPHHFGFFDRQTEEQKVVTKAESRELFREAVRRCRKEISGVRELNTGSVPAGGPACMLVLDEIAAALRYGLLEEPEVLDAMRSLLPETEIILTGRDPSPGLMGLADYISEIRKVRHPYDLGITARRGVER